MVATQIENKEASRNISPWVYRFPFLWFIGIPLLMILINKFLGDGVLYFFYYFWILVLLSFPIVWIIGFISTIIWFRKAFLEKWSRSEFIDIIIALFLYLIVFIIGLYIFKTSGGFHFGM